LGEGDEWKHFKRQLVIKRKIRIKRVALLVHSINKMAYSTGSNFGRTNYSHKEQMIRCGISSLKCFDGEDLSKTILTLKK